MVESTPAWAHAGLILCYVSLPSEVDTSGLIARARERGCPVGVPRVVGGELRFYEAPASASAWVRNSLGVREPGEGSSPLEVPAAGRTLVLVPGLLFDAEGYRLGRGGGHYDRFLARVRPLGGVTFVGLCFDEQLVARLPRDPWDEAVHAVVTEGRGLVECSSGAP